MKPHRRWVSTSDEVMQITLTRGEWIQVALNIGTYGTPSYEIVQLSVMEDGTPELRGNLPIEKWHHDAQPLEEPS